MKHQSVSRKAILNSFLRFVLVSPRTKPLLSFFSGLSCPYKTIEIINVDLSHQVQSFSSKCFITLKLMIEPKTLEEPLNLPSTKTSKTC